MIILLSVVIDVKMTGMYYFCMSSNGFYVKGLAVAFAALLFIYY